MMETKHFIFAISPTNPTKLHEQVCLALDVYNELVAREKLPKIWAITDYLNTKHTTQKSPKKQHRLLRTILGVINLVLGLFLLIPSLSAPSEMLLTLCVGMFAAFVGLWALLQKPSDKKKSKKIPKSLAQSAMSLLEHASHLQANEN